MPSLEAIVSFCDERVRRDAVEDFPGALNGLQFANDGGVSKIGAAVDAGLEPFRKAAAAGIDFLVVHHGLFWQGAQPVVGPVYAKTKTLIESNLAVYASHLPLDAHPEIGNNALLSAKIGLEPAGAFLDYKGVDIGFLGAWREDRAALAGRLEGLFGGRVVRIEEGPARPRRVAVVTGSGGSAIDQLGSAGADTLVTGELKQHNFNQAQELGINLYACGHYATETFGVAALAAEVAAAFDLPWSFVETDCPL